MCFFFFPIHYHSDDILIWAGLAGGYACLDGIFLGKERLHSQSCTRARTIVWDHLMISFSSHDTQDFAAGLLLLRGWPTKSAFPFHSVSHRVYRYNSCTRLNVQNRPVSGPLFLSQPLRQNKFLSERFDRTRKTRSGCSASRLSARTRQGPVPRQPWTSIRSLATDVWNVKFHAHGTFWTDVGVNRRSGVAHAASTGPCT